MKTEIEIEGEKFLINGKPTYEGISYKGKSVEGLLMNSRMIQAIIDDENPETASLWAYPDTGKWDADRNTDDFCSQLLEYKKHGLLAVTIGLQGGGSIYTPSIWENCIMSAFNSDGSLKKPYTERLLRVLAAADECGMIVIVNYFYWKQIRFIPQDEKVFTAVETVTDWLLKTGYKNILVDIANECADWWNRPVCQPANMVNLIQAAKSVQHNSRRLLISSSTGGDNLPTREWADAEDFSLPHGNGNTPEMLRKRIREFRNSESYKRRPRPVLINEDGMDLENLEAAVAEYASWGYYSQGKGSRGDIYEKIWGPGGREDSYSELSGFQSLPINYAINTGHKREFFNRIKMVTGSS